MPPLGGAALVFARVVLARGRGTACSGAWRWVTASFGAILAATIPLWVVLLSGLIGTPVSVASQVRLAVGFGGIAIVA